VIERHAHGSPVLAERAGDRTSLAEADALAHRRQAAALIQKWQDEEGDYDQKIWPLIEQELDSLRTWCRE
jgi:hypothetical protein